MKGGATLFTIVDALGRLAQDRKAYMVAVRTKCCTGQVTYKKMHWAYAASVHLIFGQTNSITHTS